jgi:phenylacetate-CoA ligase
VTAAFDLPVLSIVPGLAWPAMPPDAGQTMLAAQFQLERSQWWPAQVLARAQLRQLRALAAHAVAQVPHYAGHLAAAGLVSAQALDAQSLLRWPLLDKREIQADPARFEARAMPSGHGEWREVITSGSTGEPLRAATTDTATFVQHALVMRSHLWFGMDMRAKFAAVRASYAFTHVRDWGPPANAAFLTGPSVYNKVFEDHGAQLDWLMRERPAYLLAHNTNLRALLEHSRRDGPVPASVRTVVGFGDMPAPDTRELARALWDAEYFDTYSASEVGAIAFECPERHALHVQAEHIYLEVLRDDGTPCAPGEAGRVVITDLQNFAMPLIRYQLRDHAVPGPPCACGRGLPVLERIVGRTAHLAVDPTGRRFFAHLNMGFWVDVAPIRQRQIVQTTPASLDVRYVADRVLAAGEEDALRRELRDAMRYDYAITFTRVERIALSAAGKFHDFLSLLDQDAGGALA